MVNNLIILNNKYNFFIPNMFFFIMVATCVWFFLLLFLLVCFFMYLFFNKNFRGSFAIFKLFIGYTLLLLFMAFFLIYGDSIFNYLNALLSPPVEAPIVIPIKDRSYFSTIWNFLYCSWHGANLSLYDVVSTFCISFCVGWAINRFWF